MGETTKAEELLESKTLSEYIENTGFEL